MKPKLLISACLLGMPCRYNGTHKKLGNLNQLAERYELVGVCPETLGGLKIPRLPCEQKEGKVYAKDGIDCSPAFDLGARRTLAIALKSGAKIALLKERSPSCGVNQIYDGTFSDTKIKGMGVAAALLKANGIRVYSEEEMNQLFIDHLQ